VVRLKGGDPFVFGRGGEEAEALAAAGIPFEVVPGVSSAVAAPAAAGIPVTHRAVASSFAVVTGHEDDRRSFSRVDWARLATAVDTLVILMGLENLPRITRALRGAGRAADTPAAVIERGATTDERVVVGRLDTIAALVTAAGVRSPAVIVVGDVVALRSRLLGGVASGSGEVGVGAGEQGVGAEAELSEELMQVLLGER
jgi:uroporphyrinogen III methyltransferase/synthase